MTFPLTEPATSVFALHNPDGSARRPGAGSARWGTEIERILMALIAEAGDFILPNLLVAVNITGGDENNIVGVPSHDPSPISLYQIVFTATNTANMTLNIGDGAMPLLSSSGNPITPGALTPGPKLAISDGGNFYLLSELAQAAILAATEEARDLAKAWAEGTEPGGEGTLSAREWADQAAAATIASFDVDNGVWNGSDNEITLVTEPVSEATVLFFEGGVRQVPGVDFTVTGTTLTRADTPAQDAPWSYVIIRTNASTLSLSADRVTDFVTQDLASRNVPTPAKSVITSGYSGPGDGGGAPWHEVANDGPLLANQRQSNGGTRRWQLSPAIVGNPMPLGAKGDGSFIDDASYSDAQSVYDSIWLPVGKTFRLNSETPHTPIHGPGSLQFGEVKVEGNAPLHYADRALMKWAPTHYPFEVEEDYNPNPSGGSRVSMFIGSGVAHEPVEGGTFARVTVVGIGAGMFLEDATRLDVFGNYAMRWARFGERGTAVGNITQQWLGQQQSKLREYFHEFFCQAPDGQGGSETVSPDNPDIIEPGHAEWDYQGLESRNPGVGQKIKDTPDAADRTEVRNNVSLGRDSCHHLHLGIKNVAIGYRAGGHFWHCDANTAVGDAALHDCLFGDYNVGVGRQAGAQHQEGEGNVFIGRRAGHGQVRGEDNVYIGHNSGFDDHKWDDCSRIILIGARAGNNTDIIADDDVLVIGSRLTARFITGKMGGGGENFTLHPSTDGILQVGMGTVVPSGEARIHWASSGTIGGALSRANATSERNHIRFEDTDGHIGSITSTNGIMAYGGTSDPRAKIYVGEAEGWLDRVMQVPVHRYHRKGIENAPIEEGFFADEVAAVFPQAVLGEKDGMEDIGTVRDPDGEVLAEDVLEPDDGEWCDGATWEKTGERMKLQILNHPQMVVPLWSAVQELAQKVQQLEEAIQ